MNCKCRTKVFDTDDVESFENDIKELNKKALYYFVIVDRGSVYLERASLIIGKTEEIRKEKELLIRELNERKVIK